MNKAAAAVRIAIKHLCRTGGPCLCGGTCGGPPDHEPEKVFDKLAQRVVEEPRDYQSGLLKLRPAYGTTSPALPRGDIQAEDIIKVMEKTASFVSRQDIEQARWILASNNEPTNPELWAKIQKLVKGEVASIKVKGKEIEGPNDGTGFTVFPSAYANGWAAKVYKGLGGGWKKQKKNKTSAATRIARRYLEGI